MDGLQYDTVLLEGAAHGLGEALGNLGVVGREIAHLEPVVFGAVLIDRRHEVVAVHEEGVFRQRAAFAARMGRREDRLDDGVARVADLVVLLAVRIALELQEGGIKGCRFGVDHPAPNGHAIVLHGRLQRRFLAG